MLNTQALLREVLCVCGDIDCVCVGVSVCSNGVEAEGMLVHGATGGRSCYKTCHFLSSSKLRPILPHVAGVHRL